MQNAKSGYCFSLFERMQNVPFWHFGAPTP